MVALSYGVLQPRVDWINIKPLRAKEVKLVKVMLDENKTTPTPEEAKKAEEAKAEAEKKAKEEADAKAKADLEVKEAKVGEILNPKEPPKEDARMVPEAVLLEYKNQNKELRKDIRELIESGASKTEVSEDLDKIAEEHNVDIGFLNKLAKSIKSSVEAEMVSKMKPIQDRENSEKIDKIFKEHFGKTLEAMPEFKGVVKEEVIKALSLSPENANKTFAQIIEETYGHLIPGRKTIESQGGRGGGEITEIDFVKAKKDTEYFKEIMANPELKKKYNESLVSRLKL